MCEILNKSKRKQFTGYKVVNKINGRYYSAMTGIEYKNNSPVIAVDDIETYLQHKENIAGNTHFVDFKQVLKGEDLFKCYNPKMVGKTAVFVYKKDAEAQVVNEIEVVVKMTISKNLYNGSYKPEQLMLGEFIESIEEL